MKQQSVQLWMGCWTCLLLTGLANAGGVVPPDFDDQLVFAGLSQPTSVEFSADGRVFVAEKSGLIWVYPSIDDNTPTLFADLQADVYDFWDRGLLGFALHPDFPTVPFVYVLYTLDAAPGDVPPTWGDTCPSPPGPTTDGCGARGRLSRLEADGNITIGPEVILIDDWCQQFPSHSVGDLGFGLDGALYVAAGDGASFVFSDHGQVGNPCDDPPFEGGALRSQDLRTDGDPVGLDGALLRLDPLTGAALPDNPLFGGTIPDDDRIIAYGLRNPYRLTVHPTTGEIWIGDVGWVLWEEINRVTDPTDDLVENFGWPCYEGPLIQSAYDALNLPICESLYAEPDAVVPPHFAFHHQQSVAPQGGCGIGGSAISGLAFYGGGDYPAEYDDALFFADYSRKCIYTMFADAGGLPDPGDVANFVSLTGNIVDLEIGPGGDLFYLDYQTNQLRRVTYEPPLPEFIRGDTNGDGVHTIGDPIFNLAYLFQSGPSLCLDAQDTNDNGGVSIDDPIYGLLAIFSSGPPPPPPYGPPGTGCGPDPTDDAVECEEVPSVCD